MCKIVEFQNVPIPSEQQPLEVQTDFLKTCLMQACGTHRNPAEMWDMCCKQELIFLNKERILAATCVEVLA